MSCVTNRCTGHCCRDFAIPFSPEQLRQQYDAWRSGADSDAAGANIRADIHLIAPMVRLTRTKGEGAQRTYHYRCVHLEENGDCGIYPIRPQMCRSFPDDKGCSFAGCTWAAVRLPHEMRPEPKREPSKEPTP